MNRFLLQLVNLKVVSKAADRLTVQLDGTVHFLPLPLHHLSDFKTIAEAKYSLAKPNCVFRGLVVRPRENLGEQLNLKVAPMCSYFIDIELALIFDFIDTKQC